MTRTFHCECGCTIEGDDENQILVLIREHLTSAHRDLAGTGVPASEDLLAMTVSEPLAPVPDNTLRDRR